MRRAEPGALGLAALAGASLFISWGTLALGAAPSVRIGALPPFWLAAALPLAGVAAAWAFRLRTADAWPLALTLLLWLPWLPVRVPPPLLFWEGPLEVAVWAVALGGVAVVRLQRAPALGTLLSRADRAPWLVALVVFACSAAAGRALHGVVPLGDEPHYLIITQSLLGDGDLKIENNHARGDYLQYTDVTLPPDYLRRGTDGEIYSVHAPGVSALVLPAFVMGGYPAARAFMALLGALAVAWWWRAAYDLGERTDAAWMAAGAVAASATFFLHSFTIFPDPAGAVVVSFALWMLMVLERRGAVAPAVWLAAGGALAALPWLHTRFALIAGTFALVLVGRLFARGAHAGAAMRRLAAFACVPVVSALAWFAFFWTIYGTPDPSAPYGGSRQNAIEWMPRGLAGLAFDQQFGLAANAPVFALVPYGWFVLWRHHRRLALELAAVAVPYLAVVASFAMWWGGASGAARFLVPLMPLAVPPLVAVWQKANTALRTAFVALTVLGAGNTSVRVLAGDGQLAFNQQRSGYDVLLDWLSPHVQSALAFPSLHRLGVELALLVAAIWLVSGATGLLLLWLSLRRHARGPGARWALACAIGAVCAMAAASVAWHLARTVPATPSTSAAGFLRRWAPDTRPETVRLAPLRRVSASDALFALELRGVVRGRPLQDPPLLFTPRLPAGRYRLVLEGGAALAGTLQVSIGTTSQPLERWVLDGHRPGATPFVLELPAVTHSVMIRGDDEARASLRQVGLRPERVEPVPGTQYVLRAGRFGLVKVFGLDDAAYLEPGGLWTRGDAEGALLVLTDGGLVEVDVAAGPAPARLDLQSGAWSTQTALDAHERRRLQVPPGEWRMQTSGAFRPKDHDPGNPDARWLGVRIEFPEPALGQ